MKDRSEKRDPPSPEGWEALSLFSSPPEQTRESPPEGELVSVVVVNFNGGEGLLRCLESLGHQTYAPLEILVVDNGSTDGSLERVQKEFPQVRTIALGQNTGFANASNVGTRQAGGDIVALLNPDAEAGPEWLAALVNGLGAQIGVTTSRVLNDDEDPRISQMNGTLNLVGHNIIRVFADPEQIFYASGCAMAFRRSQWGEPFDPDYFLYGEDAYFSLRVRLAGYQVRMIPDSLVVHHRTSPFVSSRGRIAFYQQRNRILNLLLFLEKRTLWRILPLLVVGFLAETVRRRGNLWAVLAGQAWFFRQPHSWLGKRARLQATRRIPDGVIIGLLSSRLLNGDGKMARLANRLSGTYCRWIGLRTIDSIPE